MSAIKRKKTLISNVIHSIALNIPDSEIQPENMKTEDIIEGFNDGINPFNIRLKFLQELQNRDLSFKREAIINLCQTCLYSQSKDLISFIKFLFRHGQLDIFDKIECAKTLQFQIPSISEYWLDILDEFRATPSQTRQSILIYIDTLERLLIGPVQESVSSHINWLLFSSGTSLPFIYKTIVSYHRRLSSESSEYVNLLYTTFFFGKIDDQHSILSAQYLLGNKIESNRVEERLLKIASDTSRAHNIRADSADTLLKLGRPELRPDLLRILAELGRDTAQAPTLINNRENAHNFDSSVSKFLLELGGHKILSKDESGIPRSFDDIVQLIRNMPRYQQDRDKIDSSLLRLRIDQILYPGSQTLSTIFIRIFQIIERHENKDLLTERLLDELVDMADTCSTGHANRLANVFSGINGFFLRMEWKDQIKANLSGRLTARAKCAIDIETRNELTDQGITPSLEQLQNIDERFREQILYEMLKEEVEERVHWHRFLRSVISSLHEEMRHEFVSGGHIEPEEFELYFRQAMIFYETGHSD